MTDSAYDLSEKLAWDGDTLRVTGDKLLGKLNKPYLSASTAKSMSKCQAMFVGKKALPDPSHVLSANQLGTASHFVGEVIYGKPAEVRDMEVAHTIIKAMLSTEPTDVTIPADVHIPQDIASLAYDLASLAKGKTPNDPSVLSAFEKALGSTTKARTAKGLTNFIRAIWTEKVTSNVQNMLTMEDPKSVDVHSTEMMFGTFDPVEHPGKVVKISGVPSLGYIDRIDHLDRRAGTVEVVDYKSGKVQDLRYGDDHGDQIRLYKAAVEAVDPSLSVTSGRLLYITAGQVRTVNMSDAAVQKSVKDFKRSWDALQNAVETRTFPTEPGPLCGWCPLVNSCPVARPARSPKDQRAALPSAAMLGIPSVRKGAAVLTEPRSGGTIDSTPKTKTRSTTMGRKRTEDKPYVEEILASDGQYLNLNSYAATATISLLSWSAEVLAEHDVALNPNTIRQFAGVLGRVIRTAETTVSGGEDVSWQMGLNTRVRSALHTFLELKTTDPKSPRHIPFGKTAEDFAAWETLAARFCTSIILSGEALHRDGIDSEAFSGVDLLTA